jgi:hypothetical protein
MEQRFFDKLIVAQLVQQYPALNLQYLLSWFNVSNWTISWAKPEEPHTSTQILEGQFNKSLISLHKVL